MPTFSYEIREQDGDLRRGTTQGESAEAVARELRAQGYFVITVETAARPKHDPLEAIKRRVLAPVFYPVSSKSRAMFYSSLRALMQSGMSVSEATGTLGKRTRNRTLAQAATEMADEAVRGHPMTSVMRRYPSAFPQIALAAMEAGEQSGLIEATAERLAQYFDRAFELEQTYRWHTFYPKILIIALILIPSVKTLFLEGFMPWLSVILGQSLPLLLAIAVVWYGWRLLAQIAPIKKAIDRVKLSLPWFGSLSRRLSTARWARALSMLLRAGVPIHRSLVVASSAAGNAAMEEALTQQAEGVLQGQTVAESLAESKVLPDMALDMIATAERSGSFEDALERIADYYESETDVGGKQTAIAVGIVFYLIVAAVIGFMVISFWGGYFSQYDSLLGP
ncbi:MAG: type II secretion system F family protein [Armatimonadetes bacterium]|nr:type II secretion system F family protein [Armatimonadota bacterium]